MKLGRLITRRRAKWIGMVAWVLCGLLFLGSCWVSWGIEVGATHQGVSLRGGGGKFSLGIRIGEGSRPKRLYLEQSYPVNVHPFHVGKGFWLQPGDVVWGNPPRRQFWLRAPLSLPLFLIAIPTAWLWYTDRRARPWQCAKCRYDLRGLEGMVCPECGSVHESGGPKKNQHGS
jgi:hypothetical protein